MDNFFHQDRQHSIAFPSRHSKLKSTTTWLAATYVHRTVGSGLYGTGNPAGKSDDVSSHATTTPWNATGAPCSETRRPRVGTKTSVRSEAAGLQSRRVVCDQPQVRCDLVHKGDDRLQDSHAPYGAR